MDPQPSLTVPQWLLLGEAALPLPIALVLNVLRPDLMSLFLASNAGRLIAPAVLVAVTIHLAVLQLTFVSLNRHFPPSTPGRRRRMALVAGACLLLLSLPATVAVLMGPVAVAVTQSG